MQVGVLSLTVVGNAVSAADMQRWRPAADGMLPGAPAMPPPPPMPPGLADSRFRPVPPGAFMMPPPPPMPAYPGRPFVSVEGHQPAARAAAPAFARQYAWRPAERPLAAGREARPANSAALSSYQRMPQARYAMPATLPYGAAAVFPPPMMVAPPPPPLPMAYPPFPGMFPAPMSVGAANHMPGSAWSAYPPAAPWWMSQPRPMQPAGGYPAPSLGWNSPWNGATPWSNPTGMYGTVRRQTAGIPGYDVVPLAGLY